MNTETAALAAPSTPGEGAAPVKTAFFQTMAAQLDAAMKGKELPVDPASPPPPPEPTPEPVKPAEPAAPKPPEKPPVRAAEKPVEKPKEPAKEPEEKPDLELANIDDPNYLPDSRHWKRIRQKMIDLKDRADERIKLLEEKKRLESELATFKSKPVVPTTPQSTEEVETLKKSIEEIKTQKKLFEDELKLVALERSPEFKAHFDGRFESAKAIAKTVVAPDKQGKVEQLMQLPPSAYRKTLMAELMADMDPVDQTQLSVALIEMDRARAEKDDALKKQGENFQRLQQLNAVKQAEQAKAMEAQKQKVVSDILAAARDQFSVFNPAADSEEEKAEAEMAERKVMDFVNERLPVDELVLLPVKAAELDKLQKKHKLVLAELEKLQATVKAYEGASGSISSGSKASGQGAKKSFKERVLELTGGSE